MPATPSDAFQAAPPPPAVTMPWYKTLSRYQWFVFIVCCLAWDLDCMDQQLFILAREPAIAHLLEKPGNDPEVTKLGAYATAVFMIGWAIGGIAFGVLGDRLGRVKTLTLTIGLYALFTGLSALSHSVTDFMFYRLLTGLGVGGAFAAAVVLLAESVSDQARPYALGLFQATSVFGNCGAALISMYLGHLQKTGLFGAGGWLTPWRVMFLLGIIPGILLVVVQLKLKEPAKWVAMREAEMTGIRPSPWQAFFGTLTSIMTTRPWSTRVYLGLLLTSAGVIGLWGIGFFSPRLTGLALQSTFEAEGLTGDAAQRRDRTMARNHLTDPESRSLLRHLRLQLGDRDPGSQAGVRRVFRPGGRGDGVHLHEPPDTHGHLLDDSDHGLLPARPVRRLRDLLAGTVSDQVSQHRHQLLLQRGAIRRGHRPLHPRVSLDVGVHGERGVPIRRSRDVLRLLAWAYRSAVLARDAGKTASGLSRKFYSAVAAAMRPVTMSDVAL